MLLAPSRVSPRVRSPRHGALAPPLLRRRMIPAAKAKAEEQPRSCCASQRARRASRCGRTHALGGTRFRPRRVAGRNSARSPTCVRKTTTSGMRAQRILLLLHRRRGRRAEEVRRRCRAALASSQASGCAPRGPLQLRRSCAKRTDARLGAGTPTSQAEGKKRSKRSQVNTRITSTRGRLALHKLLAHINPHSLSRSGTIVT